MKENKGITLVALIITIVVMLILVAVSVNILIKSNLIGITDKTVNKYKTASEDESNSEVIEIDGKKYSSIDDYMSGKEKLPDIVAGKFATEKSNYNGAVIPAGFTVSGIPSEQSIENGMVIYDIPEKDFTDGKVNWTATEKVGDEDSSDCYTIQKQYNQFVWIPVETPYVTKAELDKIIDDSNGAITTEQAALQSLADSGKYPMAVQLANETDYRGVLYSFVERNNKVSITVTDFSTTDNYNDGSISYYREPAKLSSKSTFFVNQTKEKELDLQTEYNNIVKSVKEQKGFWVARYELSHSTGEEINKAESKRGKEVSSALASSLNTWYGLYSTCKNVNLQSGIGMQGSMIYGSQWDQIMIWMKDEKNGSKFYILDSSSKGNFSTSIGGTGTAQVSGYKDNYVVKQIFDLGGNLSEWTTVAGTTDFRILMGGNYRDISTSNTSLSHRSVRCWCSGTY